MTGLYGPIIGEIVLRYVKQFLVPTLKSSDLVIMYNPSSHRHCELLPR